jgi:hypothetical protein
MSDYEPNDHVLMPLENSAAWILVGAIFLIFALVA